VEEMEIFIDEVLVQVEKEEALARKVKEQGWKAWVQEAIQKGAVRAHGWSQTPQAWSPSCTRTRSGRWSGQPQHQLEAERMRLTALRDCSEVRLGDFLALPKGDKEEDLAGIDAQTIRDAVRSFSAHTCHTYDGIHVKNFGMLNTARLGILARLLTLIEEVGRMPPQDRHVVTALINKNKPGVLAYRGIALFPAICRLWVRIRRWEAIRWEVKHSRAYFAFQKGAGCVDVVWRQSLLAEAAHAHKMQIAASLWDLSDFYEHIDREEAKPESQTDGQWHERPTAHRSEVSNHRVAG
jgi:hypothetical protein